MPVFELRFLIPLLPEIFLALAAMALLMIGVYRTGNSVRLVSWLGVAGLAIAMILVSLLATTRSLSFAGLFVVDPFAMFIKTLVLLGSALSIILSLGFVQREGMERFEFPILILFATVGMMMMVSANDLIALYLGLELQSLSLYVLAAFRRDSTRSTEAGLKYFVLGALSSGMLLYGASIIYGFSGTTNFETLAAHIAAAGHGQSAGFVIGLVFLLAGLAFKVSAVPFHMWTPDVYEGAPTPVTAFFSVAPKIAAIGLLLRVVVGPFGGMVAEWQQIITVISIASMLLGAFAAINQTNIKRLMAYSSIGHVGYALVGLAAGSEAGVHGVLIYMAIYLFMNLGVFTCILCMRQNGRMVEDIKDLSGLSRSHPMMALALAIFMFSMAGIPPFAGFFGKVYVFMAAIDAGLVSLAVIGVLTSVVGCFYYLRIIKMAYFDELQEPLDKPIGREMSLILTGTGLVIALFFIYPLPIINGAKAAAASLFAG